MRQSAQILRRLIFGAIYTAAMQAKRSVAPHSIVKRNIVLSFPPQDG